jgi:hypothetical protein
MHMSFQDSDSPTPSALGESQVQADSLARGRVWELLNGSSVYTLSAATTLKDNILLTCLRRVSIWDFLSQFNARVSKRNIIIFKQPLNTGCAMLSLKVLLTLDYSLSGRSS